MPGSSARPSVSVVIGAYHSAWLQETLASIANQTLADFEVLVVDDGRSDVTRRVIADMSDPRFRYVLPPKRMGPGGAFGFGLASASAPVVAFLNHDDLWAPTFLEQIAGPLLIHPEIGVAFCPFEVIDSQGDVVARQAHVHREYAGWQHLSAGTLSRQERGDKALPFFVPFAQAAAFRRDLVDPRRLARYHGAYDLYLSQHILAQPISSLFVDQTLAFWRTSAENLTVRRSFGKTVGYVRAYLLLIAHARGEERRGGLWALRSTVLNYLRGSRRRSSQLRRRMSALRFSSAMDYPERFDPRHQGNTHEADDHIGRYEWAKERVSGEVLDVACGTGFGSAMLAQHGAVVTGLDASTEAVALAQAAAVGTFRVAHVPPLPFDDDIFDAAVSFETIEHVEEDTGFLAEIRRVVKPGGTLLISTPNRALTSPNSPTPPNPFHVREYLLPDLLTMLGNAGFEHTEIWTQHPQTTALSHVVALKVVARFPRLCVPGTAWDRLAHGDGSVAKWDGRANAVYWVIRAW